MKKYIIRTFALAAVVMSCIVVAPTLLAQEGDDGVAADAPPADELVTQDDSPAAGELVTQDGQAADTSPVTNKGSGGFGSVVFGSGIVGIILWFAIFSAAGAAIYFIVDCSITVRPKRVISSDLVTAVTISMQEGDVLAAIKNCENNPGALANVLGAGFTHVEEGFEIIQESVSTAAEFETEKLMQKITWLSVVGNIAPMLGLLGTVQGMIMAFANLGDGAPDVGILANNISQALFTTAFGLMIAVPCVAFYYVFRNNANRLVLRMEALTMELIKDLRNVEVVDE
jgi:biopolymer transport protein ExbB